MKSNPAESQTGQSILRRAIVIRTTARAEERLECFLSLLGIEWEALTVEALLNRYGPEILAGREIQACLTVSGGCLADLKSELDKRQIPGPVMSRAFAGSLFHSFDQSPALQRVLEGFLSGVKIATPKLSSAQSRYRVTDKHPDMCGALSGLSFVSTEMAGDRGIEFESCDGVADTIISTDEGSLLTRVCQGSREVFVASGAEILDLREPTSTNLDYRACFSRVVPILIALRHLFRDSCWVPETHYANIVIDDPPLWPKYGHLDMRELAAMMDRTGCACTIAMIPWNYRRSDRRTVSLVASRQPRFGVCVHGCDHTAAEFGSQDREKLAGKLVVARRKMEAHQQFSGLRSQPVMVFPQGIFSVEAMACLGPGGYLAAVNTEVADYQRQARVTLHDLLNPALVCYDGSPLFIRRRPDAGTVNFAVDSFLGKPCLVVLHHDFFKGGIKNLEELVHTFANFHPQLSWDSLENIVKGCALSKREADGRKTIRIFANPAVSSLPAELPAIQVTEDSVGEKARVAARRYLCEIRDNYVAKSETLLRCARSVARSLQRR
jgi:hypothetical protein